MMRVLLVAVALCLAGSAAPDAQTGAGKGDPRFVGNWRLVAFVNIGEQGVATPSRYSGGRIMYDAAGQMAAQLTFAARPALSSPATEAQRAAAYGSFLSYYGAYEVDDRSAKVTHHVEASTNPNWPATELIRYFEFADPDTLTLSIRNAAGRVTGTLTWARIR
jgi:hypothetical protein